MKTRSALFFATLLAVSRVAVCCAHAATDGSTDLVELERYEVAGLLLGDSINPLARTSEGVFGDARSPLDTPRAVSTITQALLRERGISGVREFTAYAAGTSAPSSYGKLTTPNIRGDVGEAFLNGQRLSYNRFGAFPSFNGVEAIEVVRGPGSAIYGSGLLTGGYVNYVTKQPQFIPETTLTLRVGTWVPGGGAGSASWLNGSWQVDTTAPTADGRSAWRVSYEGKADKTFFRRAGMRDDRQDLFFAWTRRPATGAAAAQASSGGSSGGLTLDANAQFIWQASPQPMGVNRPTQELIDHGIYYSGTLPDLGIDTSTGALAGTIDGVTTAKLPRDATLFTPADFSNAVLARGQFIATAQHAADRKFISRTIGEYIRRRRYHASDEYAEYIEQLTLETRGEWHAQLDFLGRLHALLVGGTLRYEERESFVNYFNGYQFQYDLSAPRGAESRESPAYSIRRDYAGAYLEGIPGGPGGRLFFASSQGTPETAQSRLWNPALFAQDDIALGERLTLLTGARLDAYLAEARDPLGKVTGIDWQDKHSATAFSWNGSLRYALPPSVASGTVYATYQRAYSVQGHSSGGGVMLRRDQADPTRGSIDPNDFTPLSRLAEFGAKFALRENALFLGAALFEQDRIQVGRGGAQRKLRSRGTELELVYQPHARFNATANASLSDVRYLNTSLSHSGGNSLYNLYAKGSGPGGLGNGRGFVWESFPVGDYRATGHSRLVLNSRASYQFRNGLGGGFVASWQSEQLGNFAGEYHIPSQVFFDLYLFYRGEKWSVNLDILNALERRNWLHNGDNLSSHTLIWQDLPLRLEGYVKRRF